MALKKRERKPDDIPKFKTDDAFSIKFNFKFTTLPIFIKRKTTLTQHLFNKINEERKFEETKNSTI